MGKMAFKMAGRLPAGVKGVLFLFKVHRWYSVLQHSNCPKMLQKGGSDAKWVKVP